MSSLLRSSTFVRHLAGAARNLISSHSRLHFEVGQVETLFTANLHVRALSTRVPAQFSNLEKSLQQLDQDVRRVGRISRRDIEEVLEEIKQTKSATSSQSLLVIRCCGNLVPEELPQVRTKLVQEIWTTLENLKVVMDISHYNALLRVYLENEHDFSPAEFLQDLERKGVEPNRVTYQRLVTRYCQQGEIEGATRILEYMREKNLPVNESVFNALIMGHSQADDMESANGILNVMKQAGLEPSADTFTTLLVGYARKGDMAKIQEIFAECDKKDIYLLDKDHLDIVFALATNGHANLIDGVLNRTRKSSGFNQDAVNLILRLVNHGQEEVALKVLRTMPTPQREDGEGPVNRGTFLVRQLVKAKRPVEVILSTCKTLEAEGFNNKALLIATETALSLNLPEYSSKLLKAMQEAGLPIRQHYFWPLITAAGKARDDSRIVAVLKEMIEKFNMSPSGETIREYVVPNLTVSDNDHIVGLLKKVGVSSGASACALVFELLSENRIAEAADVTSKYRAFYNPLLLRRNLNIAFLRTGSVTHYLNILHHIYEGLDRNFMQEENDSQVDRKDLTGIFLQDLIVASRGKPFDIESILKGLLERGLGISSEAAEQIQGKLGGERLTNEISELLSRLIDADLQATPAVRNRIPTTAFSNDEATLMGRIEKLKSAGQSAATLQRNLLLTHCRNKEVEKAEQIFQSLESEATPGSYALLIEGLANAGRLDDAMAYYKNLLTKFPDTSLDPLKVMRFTAAFISEGRVEDGIRFLEESRTERKQDESSFSIKAVAFQMLNDLAEKGDLKNIEKVFNLLVEKQLVEVTNVIVGPLVKVHILKDDTAAAVKKIEEIADKYRLTPWKNEVTKRLIQAEDPASLQRLTDISSKVHGEVNSLYDLVFAFVECGRIRQARKILETPGLRNRQQRLSLICERYYQEGSVALLEGLAEVTRDMTHIDRGCIFDYLLASHIRSGDADKALGVWTQMQEEDIQSSDEFLFKLAEFLESKGVKVPFVKPKWTPAKVKSAEQPQSNESPATPQIIGIRNALRSKNIEQAKAIKKSLKDRGTPISAADLSLLLEGLCQSNQLNEAYDLAMSMLQSGEKITIRHFRFLSNKLATAGEVNKLTNIGKFIDGDTKKTLSFDNKLCAAYINSGKGSQYLDSLLEEAENSKPEDFPRLEEKFPRGSIGAVVEANPEFIPKFEKLVETYAKKGSHTPANVLWMSHFIAPGFEERAEHVWSTYKLGEKPKLMFQRILNHARKTQDETVLNRLINRIKDTNVSEAGLGLIYSNVIDILVTKQRADEALERLKVFVESSCLENFNTTCLQRLKRELEQQGKSFPYTIPPKKWAATKIDRSIVPVVLNSCVEHSSEVLLENDASADFYINMIGFNSSCLKKPQKEDWSNLLVDNSGVLKKVKFDPLCILNNEEPTDQKNKISSSSSSDDESDAQTEKK